MFDHDDRARRDLSGTDRFRYENGLMSDIELRNLEARYNFEDANKRFREEEERLREERRREEEERRRKEEERRREEEERRSSSSGSSSYGGSSYSSGSSGGGSYIASLMRESQDYLNQAYYYKEIVKNTKLPDKTRREAAEKVKMYVKKDSEVRKRIKKITKKESREVSKGGVWGVIIVLVILYFVFFSG